MQNSVFNMCEKFHYDGLRNGRSLWNEKSDNNITSTKNNNNVRGVWRPVPGLKTNTEPTHYYTAWPRALS